MKSMSISAALSAKETTGEQIKINGWIRTRRDSKAGFSFLAVHDGSCFNPIQVVAPAELTNYESEVKKLTSGCSVTIIGELVPSPAKGQAFEIQATAVKVIGWVEDPDSYPIQPKPHTPEYLREVAHLRPRTNLIGAVSRVRNTLAQSIHRFFHQNGYFWINTPIITASDAEGAGEMFRVSTLNLENLPRDEQGNINFKEDFFGK